MENQEQPKPKRRYKKRTKKVIPSTQGLLTDAPKEAREIPMYDPYTGEANPHYEELTGKPNPLSTRKGFTIDGIADKSRKEMLGKPIFVTGIDKKVDVEPKKDYVDVKSNTRFIVVFPQELGIRQNQVKSISRPTITFDEKRFLGLKISSKPKISLIVVDLYDLITNDDVKLNVRLNEMLVNKHSFNFIIKTLGPNNDVLETILLDDCSIDGIGFSRLTYGDDNVSTTSIKIQPRKYSIV
jgi:hypothetical protein